MDPEEIHLLPADPEQYFASIAALTSGQETEPSMQGNLTGWYNRRLTDGIQLNGAVDSAGRVIGFNSIYRHTLNLPPALGGVHTRHYSDNVTMTAIDTRLGYSRTPAPLLMVKELEND
jgi:hypothetical protein